MRLCLSLLFLGSLLTGAVPAATAAPRPEPLALVVLDPLAKELACACLKDHAQRDYRKLAARLEKAVKQKITIEFSDDLAETLKTFGPGRDVIVIGDQSLVAAGGTKAQRKLSPVCELTGDGGETTLAGLFIVRAEDPARELKDAAGRTVLMGLPAEDEKQAAAVEALRAAATNPPAKLEQRRAYTEAALEMLDSNSSPAPVAVIPEYGLALLQGCGSVRPGSLRVIGKTRPVPFIAVFLSDTIAAEKQGRITQALLEVKRDAKMLKALESRDGFKPMTGPAGKPEARSHTAWEDWRGPGRDGHVPRLPARLPAKVHFVWKKAAMTGGLAGLTVDEGRLILSERDFSETHDVYRCLDANTGETLWMAQFPARGKLDFGQSPRATPVIHHGKVYLLGAFGGLRCVSLANGRVLWERQLPREFKAKLTPWGMCSPPLVVDDLLIVNPGATNASLAALDCATGRTRWTSPGAPPAYAPFICAEFSGRRQIVGYDQHSLGGWDVKTGTRLWRLAPPADGDFNVPTPIATEDGLLVSTENNGTRLYHFDDSGRLIPKPAAEFRDLAPTTTSPVVTCGRVFGAHQGLQCLDVQHGLRPLWHSVNEAPGDHATLIADGERVLVITLAGELILLDARAPRCEVISRLRLFDDEVEVYSHPALVGSRLYARGGESVVCADLGTD